MYYFLGRKTTVCSVERQQPKHGSVFCPQVERSWDRGIILEHFGATRPEAWGRFCGRQLFHRRCLEVFFFDNTGFRISADFLRRPYSRKLKACKAQAAEGRESKPCNTSAKSTEGTMLARSNAEGSMGARVMSKQKGRKTTAQVLATAGSRQLSKTASAWQAAKWLLAQVTGLFQAVPSFCNSLRLGCPP